MTLVTIDPCVPSILKNFRAASYFVPPRLSSRSSRRICVFVFFSFSMLVLNMTNTEQLLNPFQTVASVMTAASPPLMGENGLNNPVHGHVTMNMPRFHPIAINPNTSGPPAPPIQGPYRPYGAPIMEPAPPGPLPIPSQLEQIESRLRQLEHEEAARSNARTHLLTVRKREDEDFRMVTERAEAEEEDLRRRRKRLKRESMGLTVDSLNADSPPRPAPRRLSETNAATTLAFFKQQSPLEPLPQAHPQHNPLSNGAAGASGNFRKKQKYTIKNAEAWGERHGRPAMYDPAGRALWKRPSDGNLVYLDCPSSGCGKSDFVTLHGFMCHLTKKHKDRSLGNQTRALDQCGTVYDPSAPLPQRSSVPRTSTEDSPTASTHTDMDGCHPEMGYSSVSDDDDDQEHIYSMKREEFGSTSNINRLETLAPLVQPELIPRTNGSMKPTISSMVDSNVEPEPHNTIPRALADMLPRASLPMSGPSELSAMKPQDVIMDDRASEVKVSTS
ncbi:hypothetical protein Egran_03013 [Elaphomyces granulatus]|uniref:Uncharacterized protein n=1 Tax=Elaphomyces granulatus TaxID=519963 RepID=A0A232LYH2_9EURO|nr:hypothetical protein Egran_03013 [Elaphomyces granulatus]